MSATATLVRLPVWRARFVLFALLVAFGVLVARSFYLQALQNGFLQEKGKARYARVLDIPATRGRVLDRNGEALAISTPVKSVWVAPEEFEPTGEQRTLLLSALGIENKALEARLQGTEGRDFVYLKRQLSPERAQRIADLEVLGVYQHEEYRRYYPAGELAAHLVGFTGIDEKGQEALELAFEDRLAGRAGSRRVIKDRRGRVIEGAGLIRAAQDGRDLVLSIDSKIQSLAHGALKAAVLRHRARAGSLVVLDARSGEVLALANAPSYNPNNRGRLSGAQLRNRALTDSFEPGSTLKPFTIALALETGKVSPATRVSTANGRMTMGQYTIRDSHPAPEMTVAEVLQKSSNVGAAKIALALPAEAMWDLFRAVGFGEATGSGFPGETAGRVRGYRSWRPVEQATMSYGHGISVSLMQLARAYSVIARDGELVPVSLVRLEQPPVVRQVISAQTARAVRRMLEGAVLEGGTGQRARIEGWRVAGKTGTSHKLVDGSYAADRYMSSFVGFAPVSAPRLVIAVAIDEPAAGEHFGGVVAAPVFGQVMRGALRLLGVPLDAPPDPIQLPGETLHAREGT